MYIVLIYLFFLYAPWITCHNYRIKEGVDPQFLYNRFSNLTEDLFPSDLTIILSLSRVEGTLLYSLDSNGNQLIISLSGPNSVTLDIEFRTEHRYVSLNSLCELERCRYVPLSLKIQIKTMMHLQCNDKKVHSFAYTNSQKLNKDYPITMFNKSDNKLSADLWLVNTPHIGNIYPSSAQLSGCIFSVIYNKVSINMTKHNVENICPITCVNNACNNGTCFETYNTHPVCNCTSSFENGNFCNESVKFHNFDMKRKVNFKSLRVSYKSSAAEIFNISNSKVSLRLFRNFNQLLFEIDCQKSVQTKIISTINGNYTNNSSYIIVMVLRDHDMDMKVFNNGKWLHIIIPHNHDLSKEIYEKVSGEGYIDIQYKNDIDDIPWIKLPISGDNTGVSKPVIQDAQKILKETCIRKETRCDKTKIEIILKAETPCDKTKIEIILKAETPCDKTKLGSILKAGINRILGFSVAILLIYCYY